MSSVSRTARSSVAYSAGRKAAEYPALGGSRNSVNSSELPARSHELVSIDLGVIIDLTA